MTRGGRWLGAISLSVIAIGASLVPNPIRANSHTIEPSGQRGDTTAMWVPAEGPGAATGPDEVLLLSKETASPYPAAAVMVHGFEGAPTSSLQALAWDRRLDSACTAGAPRWAIAMQGLSGTPYIAYLPCSDATHGATSDPNWVRDTFSAEDVQQAVRRVGGTDSVAGIIRGVAILYNEGPAEGPGYAYLDNVSVNEMRWASSHQGAAALAPEAP